MANPENLQENQAESVQPDMPVSGKKKVLNWKDINKTILILNLIFPLWFVVLVGVHGISSTLLLIVFSANLLLGLVSLIHRKTNHLHSLLMSLRVLAATSIILFYLPVVIMNMNQQKWLYPVKRWLYAEGVSGYGNVLPKNLPEQCGHYFFSAQMAAIAQDYHPSSYLAFYTDTATMQSYADSFGGTKTETQSLEGLNETDREYVASNSHSDYPNCPAEIPGFVISRVKPTEDLHGAVMYTRNDGNYSKGLILDYDSGYVIFWT